ncbi:MAG: cellulase family glycosylhydrolase [Frankiaceae bacterium]|nr:cellulase family glycosylhydrolase [Frankiaceae bacterium]MBV9873045.1 cellulase family glycosylhydrolase [Frankiaceae bacterium]
MRILRVCLVLAVVTGLAAPAAVSARTANHARTPGSSAPAPATRTPGHAGRWLTDKHGRVVEVHGVNLVIKKAPYWPSKVGINAADARFMHRHGFTAVRLGILMEALEPKPGQFDRAYLRAIVRTANLFARHGVRSLVDFHQDLFATTFQGEGLPTWMVKDDGVPNAPPLGFPGNYFANEALARTFDNFWDNAAGPKGKPLQSWYAGAWRRVATAFRGNSAVLGYDIFNEPWPGTGWQTCFPPAGCQSFDQTRLAPFSTRIIKAIHAVDPHHIAYYEPWQPFSESAPSYLGSPGDSESGFSFHTYCAAALGVPDTAPSRAACDHAEHTAMADGVKQAEASGDALLLTEFGATTNTGELSSVEKYADGNAIPWLEWAYCACDDPTGAGDAEALVYDPTKAPTGANVNRTTLPFLDEPYPLRTAGTPASYSFDHKTGRFRYTYRTTSPVTHHHARGKTVIFTSPLHYRHGYRARLKGAKVLAHKRARLVIRATAAKHVTVIVRPRK